MHSGNKYTFRAPSLPIRDAWFSQLQKLILTNKLKRKDPRFRNTLEPTEPMARSPAIVKKSVFRRETTKRKQVEGVSSFPGSVVATDDTEVG